jgi:hypothetical protein
MRAHVGRATLAITLSLGVALAAASDPKFTSTWKAPEAAGVSFAGKKVAALVMTSDQNLRVSGEEALARVLAARGLQTVATYRMAPAEELATPERARPWFERAAVDGIVILRPVSKDTQVTYSPTMWVTSSYSTLWGYYGYYGSSTAIYTEGSKKTDTTIVVETLVYSVPMDKLLWAGISTATNPKEAQAFIKQLVDEAVKEMRKQGLVK